MFLDFSAETEVQTVFSGLYLQANQRVKHIQVFSDPKGVSFFTGVFFYRFKVEEVLVLLTVGF